MLPTTARFAARIATSTVAVLAVGLFLTSCTGTSTSQAAAPSSESAAGVVSRLGAVPIPRASTGAPAPVTASVGHPQLVAMGAPVRANLPGGAQALIATGGPAVDTPPGGPKSNAAMPGVITVTATASTGTVVLAAADLACRDQTGAAVTLTPVGPASVTATPGQPATLRLSGSFRNGEAQINWRQAGHVLAIWDFTVEND
jgi:hypothetical protein